MLKITGIISHGNKSKLSLVYIRNYTSGMYCLYTDLFVLSPFSDFLLVEGRSCLSETVSSQDSSELSPTIIRVFIHSWVVTTYVWLYIHDNAIYLRSSTIK